MPTLQPEPSRVGIARHRTPLAMPDYRRCFVPGGTYFFTLVAQGRCPRFAGAAAIGRLRDAAAIVQREFFYRALRKFLGPADLLCIPTAPAPAPIKGSLGMDQRVGDYYKRALSLTSIAGLCRLPQVSMPVSHVEVGGQEIPVGLSLIGEFGEDLFLLEVVRSFSAQFQRG